MKKTGRCSTKAIGFHLSDKSLELLNEITEVMPYKITKTSIMERGIVLVLREIKRMAAAE